MKRLLHSLAGPLIAAALAFVAGPVRAAENPVDLRHLQGLGDVRYHHLESKFLERGFHIFVRLPESYAEREAERFPTVYLLDGGITFPLLGAYYRFLSLAGEVPDMILVGISYGTDDRRQTKGTVVRILLQEIHRLSGMNLASSVHVVEIET